MLTIRPNVYLDGHKLRRTRILKGFSIRGLAEAADVAPSTIALVERKGINRNFHPQTLAKCAEALGVETIDLVSEDHEG